MHHLNKSQLQEMLREMGIKYTADATKAQLAEILQETHHSNWLRSASNAEKGTTVRNRRKLANAHRETVASVKPEKAAERTDYKKSDPAKPRHNKRIPTGNPKSGKLSFTAENIFDPTVDLENKAMKRSGGKCELCGERQNKDRSLKTCFYIDPPEGVNRTAKHIAALCTDCYEKIAARKLPEPIKSLKKKLRQPNHSPIIHKKL
jgi:hypothetical protein